MSRRRRWSELAALALLLVASPASAQPAAGGPSEAQKNAAQALFDEAGRLTREGHVPEACAKLAESLRLYAASGTLLNLALCHERAGQTASAYTEFNDSLARAQRDRRPEREETARTHVAALAPKLLRVTVTVAAGAEAPGLEVTLDGVSWRKPSWGVATPVDPGEHVVVATAPHKVTWTRRLTVAAGGGDSMTVEVPPLADEPVATAPPATATVPGPAPPVEPSTTDSAGGSGRKTLAWVVAGVGVASAATGGVLAVLAQGKWNAAKTDCPGSLCPDESTRARDSGAGGLADAATILLAAGGAAIVTGAVLYLTAPSTPARVGVFVAPGGAAASLGGVW